MSSDWRTTARRSGRPWTAPRPRRSRWSSVPEATEHDAHRREHKNTSALVPDPAFPAAWSAGVGDGRRRGRTWPGQAGTELTMGLSAQKALRERGVPLVMQPRKNAGVPLHGQVIDGATLYLCRQGQRWVVVLESPRVTGAVPFHHTGLDGHEARFE